MFSERFNPRIPAKENATHNNPGAIRLRSSGPFGGNAKLNVTNINTPNISIALMDSLFRRPMTMSLKTMAVTGFMKSASLQHAWRGCAWAWDGWVRRISSGRSFHVVVVRFADGLTLAGAV